MSADGFMRSQIIHQPGCYIGQPLEEYLADPALSGSAFKKLLADPAGLYWESEANPLWLKPERAANRARLRGSATHCAILEGLDAYARRYVVKPDGVLSSDASLKAFLSAERKRRIADSIGGKLSKEDAQAVKQTGEREELVARIHAIDPTVQIWDPDDDTETLSPQDDQYVRLLEGFVRNEPTFSPLVRDGVAELSLYWEERGIRFKARIDYLTVGTILDVKTYGQAPRRGKSLREHCVAQAIFNGYDLQAVHNARAVAFAAERCANEDLEFTATKGPASRALIESCAQLLRKLHYEPPVFRWLFLRMGGAPTGISIPFRESDGQWHETASQITDAIERYREMRAKFGDGQWLVTHGEQEIQMTDWPLAGIAGAEIEPEYEGIL